MKLTKKQKEKIQKYDKLNRRLNAIKKEMKKGYFKNIPKMDQFLGLNCNYKKNKSEVLYDLILELLKAHSKGLIYLRYGSENGGYIDLKVDDDAMNFWITLFALPD